MILPHYRCHRYVSLPWMIKKQTNFYKDTISNLSPSQQIKSVLSVRFVCLGVSVCPVCLVCPSVCSFAWQIFRHHIKTSMPNFLTKQCKQISSSSEVLVYSQTNRLTTMTTRWRRERETTEQQHWRQRQVTLQPDSVCKTFQRHTLEMSLGSKGPSIFDVHTGGVSSMWTSVQKIRAH